MRPATSQHSHINDSGGVPLLISLSVSLFAETFICCFVDIPLFCFAVHSAFRFRDCWVISRIFKKSKHLQHCCGFP